MVWSPITPRIYVGEINVVGDCSGTGKPGDAPDRKTFSGLILTLGSPAANRRIL